jgi:ABC-type transport system involved in multi-copper enzyme maturation permease subunit
METAMMMRNGEKSPLFTMFRNEWFKQSKRRKLWIFAGITAMVPLVLAALARVLLPGQAILAREDLMATALRLLAPLVLPMMVAALSIDAFTDEIAKGSIRTTLFLPAGRTTVYWAKAMAILAGSAVAIEAMWAMSLVTGLFLPGRDSLFQWVGTGLSASMAALVPVAMIIAAVLALSQWLKSAGGILVSLILGSIVLNFLPLLAKGIGPILPTTWLGFGASAQTMTFAGLLSALVVLAAWTVLFAMAGWMRFEKRAF